MPDRNVSCGSKSEVPPLTRDVRSAPESRRRQAARSGPFRATLGLMHRSKERRYSITSSASASKFGGGLYARWCSAECCGVSRWIWSRRPRWLYYWARRCALNISSLASRLRCAHQTAVADDICRARMAARRRVVIPASPLSGRLPHTV